jgi:hypothetical protein
MQNMLGPNLTLYLNTNRLRSFMLVVNNFEVLFSCNYSIFSMQIFFFIFSEGRLLYSLGLSIPGTSEMVH